MKNLNEEFVKMTSILKEESMITMAEYSGEYLRCRYNI